ncbi:MAG: flavodoxin family protein [Clostridia bacterium]|nr:flavodoxin family protein [Clostridia bacterium]
MRVLAFNGSPRMKRSNTEKILTPFLDGIRSAGAEVELVYLRRLKIQPCTGCFNCWFRTPGICAIKDDIQNLREKLLEADIVIFATPVYLFSSSGYMKILMERLLFPLTMPEFLLVNDRVYHPIRYQDRKWKSILIANGAFDGDDVFKPLIDMYERAIHNAVDNKGESSFMSLGNIIVGFGELFTDEHIKAKCAPFFNGMYNAGVQLVKKGYIPAENLEEVNKSIYLHAGITRQQAVEKINDIISESKANFILPSFLEKSDELK